MLEKNMEQFTHKTFEERLTEFDGEISFYDFDWGEDKGREQIGYKADEDRGEAGGVNDSFCTE